MGATMKRKFIMPPSVHDAENCVRDIKNWLAVFKTEYGLSKEAIKTLQIELDKIGESIGHISCTLRGIDAATVRPVANHVRDAKNWLAVFAKEYDIAPEAKRVLTRKFDELGKKIGQIECR